MAPSRGSSAAIGAWATSRTVGLPLVGTGVEPGGVADVATVALELAAVAVVVLGPDDTSLADAVEARRHELATATAAPDPHPHPEGTAAPGH